MAKIRVYELAKKLSMTNKALLTKLKAMNIEVKSHMSSLEDETVLYIKETLFGKKNKNSDTRVRPSVIRRRKKKDEDKAKEFSSDKDGDDFGEESSLEYSQSSHEASHGEEEDVDVLGNEDAVDMVKDNEESSLPTLEKELSIQPSQSEDENRGSNVGDAGMERNRENNGIETESLPVAETVEPGKPSGTTENFSRLRKNKSDVSSKAKIIRSPLETKKEESPVKAGTDDEVRDKKDSSISPEPFEEPAGYSVEKGEQIENLKITEPDMPKKSEKNKLKKTPNISELHATEPVDKADAKNVDEKQTSLPGNGDDGTDSSAKDKEASAAQIKKRKRKKKQRKSEPAKIIKLAVPLPKVSDQKKNSAPKPASTRKSPAEPSAPRSVRTENRKHNFPQVKTPDVSDVQPQPLDVDKADPSKVRRKKDKKKKAVSGEITAPEKNFRGGQRKRRAVVEGKDLYEKSYGGRKSRKKEGRNKKGKAQKTQITVPKAIKRRIKLDETIELSELAKRMGIKANEMIRKLMGMGVMATVNQTIDFDTAALVAAEFEYEVEKASAAEDVLLHVHDEDDPEKLVPRSPVVTIMGHVDHGKTSLLDVIRKSKITTGEAGGITQHIGAYNVETPNGVITFLDTPGHAAFTSMRSRGAQVTDLVVLVVAADDGVMPQTIEAINHSKAAGVPVVVAVNKMDKPDADPDRVMRELSEHGLLAEDWGGDVIFAKVSAKAETGINELLEMILLQAEVLELKANPERSAMGHVIEARLDAGRGPVATVLVQHGTLKSSQPIVCGLHSGKIRVMIGDLGGTIEEAGPSTPVEIVGLNGVPEAGDEFIALDSEKDAKQISESRMQKERAKELAKKSRANLEKLFANMGTSEIKELKLIIKADVHGSLEALNDSLLKLAQDEVDIKIVHSGTGAINESDVSLAAVSDAIIIGFNVRPTPKVREMAKEENVDMRFYDIIYNVINDIKTALTGLMPSTFHEIIIGRAEVRDTFVIPGKGTIAGCYVLDGKVARGEKIRLLRDGVVKCNNELLSLRRFKDDVKEVSQGYECGIGIEKFNDIKVGDIIECYQVEERKASLENIKE